VLLDGNGGRQALDLFDIRLFDAVEELARVGGKRFDIAALPFRIERVERERGLARAGKPRHDGQ